VKDMNAPQRTMKPKIFLSDGILTVIHMSLPDVKEMVVQYNAVTGEVLKELAPPTHLVVENADGEIFNTRNTPGIFDFLHTSSDTLYHFNIENNKIVPIFTMTYSSSEQLFKQYVLLNKDLILTNVVDRGLVVTDLKNNTSSYAKVVNDYYGNIPVQMSVVSFRNGYYVNNVQPEQLMEEIEKRLSEKSCTENDRKTLEKTLSGLKEGENNVVFIGKLKSDIILNLR